MVSYRPLTSTLPFPSDAREALSDEERQEALNLAEFWAAEYRQRDEREQREQRAHAEAVARELNNGGNTLTNSLTLTLP